MSGRIRSFKPEWLEDEALIMCSVEARLLSAALILLADDYGNDRFVPTVMAARVFPAIPLERLASVFSEAVKELVDIRFMQLYRIDGQNYFSIRNWAKHQRVDKPGKPRVPSPSQEALDNFRESPGKVRESLAPDPIRSDPIRKGVDHAREPREEPPPPSASPGEATALATPEPMLANAEVRFFEAEHELALAKHQPKARWVPYTAKERECVARIITRAGAVWQKLVWAFVEHRARFATDVFWLEQHLREVLQVMATPNIGKTPPPPGQEGGSSRVPNYEQTQKLLAAMRKP